MPLIALRYGTKFHCEPLPADKMARWSSVPLHAELRWPEPNPFIPTDFALVCDSEEGKAEEAAAAAADAAAAAAAKTAAVGHGATGGAPPPPSTDDIARGLHPGICCDASGLGVSIMGMRYHKRGSDYDLCQAEFDKLGADEKVRSILIPPDPF